ncbi:MAG TPA: CpaD family pilus assembly lipoprotein [Rhizomicrobium sp.]|jgi:pilus assembly protein CpaD
MSNHVMRLATLSAMLLAGSCAAPVEEQFRWSAPDSAHQITVAPDYRAVRVAYTGGPLAPEDAGKLDRVVQDYLAQGDGSLSVSAPEGQDSSQAITYFGERLAQMGVPRSRILVGTHPVNDGDRRVEVGFVAYVAHTDPCGDWSKDASKTGDNLPMPDFGCASQHNLAAMVVDPRDLDQARRLDDAPDATRRAVVIGHYEKGEITQADKRTSDKAQEQSAPGSGIGE